LSVRATDEAVHSQRKSTGLHITVISVAEDSTGPLFSKKVYTGSVSENEPAGTNVLTVNARYTGNPLADVEYFIYNVTANNRGVPLVFEIDSDSGVISTSGILDREANAEEYELDIIAVTRGTPSPQTSVCKVQDQIINLLTVSKAIFSTFIITR
jgi:protocadherin Fat 4